MKQTRQILTAGLCFTFLLSSAVTEMASAAGDEKSRKQRYEQKKEPRGNASRDRNYTLEEYVKKRMRRADRRFTRLDRDQSKNISENEYPEISVARLPAGIKKDPDFDLDMYQQCVRENSDEQGSRPSWDTVTAQFDDNGDTEISISEFRSFFRAGAIEKFSILDVDASGELSRSELRAAKRSKIRNKRQARAVRRACIAEQGNNPGGGTTASTAGILCNYVDSTYNDSESVKATSTSAWTCSESSRTLAANGLPDHAVGIFPNAANPNRIAERAVSATLTLSPTETMLATQLGGPRGPQGYVLNGVKIDAGTGGSCDDSGDNCSLADNSGNWKIEALGQTSFDFGTDENNAHVQPDGQYHYHGIPEGFVARQGGSSSTMTLIGWAADGFPVYARYGHSVADDATSELKRMTGSYQLVSTGSDTRPSTDVYPLGTFQQDWEYVPASGDLDECNGRVGVTPEFPAGIYHYYATDTYPYFQRCVKGEVEAPENNGPRPGGIPPE